jgi:hypothetical protein
LHRFGLCLSNALGLHGLRSLFSPLPFGCRFLLDGVLLGVRQPLRLVLLGVRLLADLSVELELLAFDLLIGDANVLNLELHFTRLDRLRVGDVNLLLDRSHFEAEGLVRLGDLGVDADPLLLLLLPCLLFFDLGIAIRVGGGDAGVFQRLLDPWSS